MKFKFANQLKKSMKSAGPPDTHASVKKSFIDINVNKENNPDTSESEHFLKLKLGVDKQ